MAVNNDDALNITGAQTVQTPTVEGPGPVKRFLRAVLIELKKTTWPTRDELTTSTVVVVATILVVTVFLWACDQGAAHFMMLKAVGIVPPAK